jgi:hypothetical protein
MAAGSYGQVSNSGVPQPNEVQAIAPPESARTAIAPSAEETQPASNDQVRYDADAAAILSGIPSHIANILPGTTTTNHNCNPQHTHPVGTGLEGRRTAPAIWSAIG